MKVNVILELEVNEGQQLGEILQGTIFTLQDNLQALEPEDDVAIKDVNGLGQAIKILLHNVAIITNLVAMVV